MAEAHSGTSADSAADHYQSLCDAAEKRIAELRSKDGRFAVVRLLLFGLALAALGLAFFSSVGTTAWVLFAILAFSFLFVVILNEPLRDELESQASSTRTIRRLMARLQRDWESLPWKANEAKLKTVDLEEHQKDVADDLDLLGRTSLFQFLSMAGTTVGVRTIANWITGPAVAVVASARSKAVEALAPRRDERIRFYSLASDVGSGTGDPDAFIAWSQQPGWLITRRWLLVWANVSAAITILSLLLLVAFRFELVDRFIGQVGLFSLLGVLGINVLITTLLLAPAHQIFSVAMSSRQSVDEYRELFSAASWLTTCENVSERLTSVRETLAGDEPASAVNGMNALGRVAAMGSLRTSATTFLLYLPLQAFALWDVRVLKRLEDWQSRFKDSIPSWFEAFGELEALMSLAAVHDENPDWVFPTWADEDSEGTETRLSSVELGHPLLPDDDRVCNDVTIGPAGTVLLVTGSNMSGKSTMLRSVGLNVALAGAGAPVCANRLVLPSIELATSIRVRDNLAEGVSFYMAELHRLKGVVDRAQNWKSDNTCVSLFLLDEILQGTNSRERQIAVTQVLRHLIECGAIGAISTHDLELADEPELQAVSNIVHFRETITTDSAGKETMTFDYQMRTGVSPTTNALRLLEIVGLGKAEH
ncbi:MAG: MutS family DNA mismatch repair protein [Planctomycetota bacterium]